MSVVRRTAAGILALVAALALAACGGSDSSEPSTGTNASGSGGQEPVTVQVGLAPITPSASIYLGMEKGFFEDEGLKLKLVPIENGAASIAALVAGSNQFGQAAYFSAISAIAEGVPVKVVAANDGEGTTAGDASLHMLMVNQGSDVQDVKDLEGKTMGISALKSGAEIATRASLEAQGVDADKVKYLAVPWANQPSALERGQVDAIDTTEPFLTPLLSKGVRAIDAPLVTLANGASFPNSGFLASDEYIAKNPEIVERFARAVQRSAEYAQEHPDEVRKILPTFTDLKAEVVKDMRLPVFGAPLDMKLVDLSIQEAAKTGVIEEAPTSEDVIYETAREEK